MAFKGHMVHLLEFFEMNTGVCCGDFLSVDNLGLFHPFVALAQRDVPSVALRVSEFREGFELFLELRGIGGS